MTDQPQQPAGNLWLADELWALGGVQFGDFTLGRTAVNSPIHINVRRLISNPVALARIAGIMRDQLKGLLTRRHPQMRSFELVAGVPMGGLHLATAFSLSTQMPMIYRHPAPPDRDGEEETIEGIYRPGQTCLVIDDLITGGRSIEETALALRDAGLHVHDAVVLVDRQEGGREALRELGINLIHVLTLEQVANYLMSQEHITEVEYRRTMDYIDAHRGPRTR